MKIVYESDFVTLYQGDSREVLPEIGKESVDLVATDPPYGAAFRSNYRKDRFELIEGDGRGEAEPLLAQVVADIVRVTRRSRHLYSFGLPLEHRLLAMKAELVWDKGRIGTGDLSQCWGPSHEPIYFHVRAADKTNADRGTGALAARLRRGSIVRVRRLSANQVHRHPTEKPVELMRQIVESSSTAGEIVLDPFAGVGSTLVACVISSRRAIGIELDEAYAEIAAARIRAAELLMQKVVGL